MASKIAERRALASFVSFEERLEAIEAGMATLLAAVQQQGVRSPAFEATAAKIRVVTGSHKRPNFRASEAARLRLDADQLEVAGRDIDALRQRLKALGG